NILEPRNPSDEEPDSDHDLDIDLAEFFYTAPVQPSVAPPSPPPIYQPLV
ncbi:2075_t:CDS:1, partial [Cetraspora pellucida]